MAHRIRGPFKPGHVVPRSGQVHVINRLGNPTGREVTVVAGERFPPQPKKGQTYVMSDPTKHKRRS